MKYKDLTITISDRFETESKIVKNAHIYQYDILIERDENELEFTFDGSIKDFANDKKINKDDLLFALQCFFSDCQCVVTNDYIDYCQEFGYDANKRESEDIFFACKEQLKRAFSMFTQDEIDEYYSQLLDLDL